jgi:hypothetical protein
MLPLNAAAFLIASSIGLSHEWTISQRDGASSFYMRFLCRSKDAHAKAG